MILPVGTKVQVTEGDTVRKKGSVGYASSFLPVFGSSCIDALQLVVFTRLGKKGKSRLAVIPVACKIVNYEDIVPTKDLDLFNKIAVRDGIKAERTKKITMYKPSMKTQVKVVKDDKIPKDLAEWYWIDFFAYLIAELLFLSTVKAYYKAATVVGPWRIPQEADMKLEGIRMEGQGIPAPAARGGLMDLLKMGSARRAAHTLIKSIDNDSEYNIDYMEAEFRDTGSRRRMMQYLRRIYAMNTPALRFYDAYLKYYQSIAVDFVGFSLQHYNNNKKALSQLEKLERDNPKKLNSTNDGLFTVFAMNVGESAKRNGRGTCKYVLMLPEEIEKAELVSGSPIVRHRLFGEERRRGGGGQPGEGPVRRTGRVLRSQHSQVYHDRPADFAEAEPVFGEPEPERPRPAPRQKLVAVRWVAEDHPNEAEMAGRQDIGDT